MLQQKRNSRDDMLVGALEHFLWPPHGKISSKKVSTQKEGTGYTFINSTILDKFQPL